MVEEKEQLAKKEQELLGVDQWQQGQLQSHVQIASTPPMSSQQQVEPPAKMPAPIQGLDQTAPVRSLFELLVEKSAEATVLGRRLLETQQNRDDLARQLGEAACDVEQAATSIQEEIAVHDATKGILHAMKQRYHQTSAWVDSSLSESYELRYITEGMYEVVGLGPVAGKAKLRELS